MPEEKKSLGPVKRFGVRYGRTLKHKLAKIEVLQKAKQKCPYCLKTGRQVKRLSAGIYLCKKCNTKFTGGAYTLKSEALAEI